MLNIKSKSTLNDATARQRGYEYIVLNNFNQVGNFYRAARRLNFLQEGNILHRGHVTAVVQEAVDAAAQETLQNLELAGFDPNIIKLLEQKIYFQLSAMQPALAYDHVVHIVDRFEKAKVEYTIIFPQLAKANLGVREESALYHAVEEITNDFLKTHGDLYVDIGGSKSIIDATSDIVDQVLIGKGKVRAYKKRHKGKILGKKTTKRVRLKTAPVQKLRDSKGQFTSPMNIQAILNAKIKEQVADNMGKGGALVYRTGRFAQSVSVNKVMQSRQGTLTAYYTYMKAPYQTFERGFKQGSLRRDPRKLISSSIREIAAESLNHKLHIKTRRV